MECVLLTSRGNIMDYIPQSEKEDVANLINKRRGRDGDGQAFT